MKDNLVMIIPDLGNGGAEHSFSKLSIELGRNYLVTIATFSDEPAIYPFGGKLFCLDNHHRWPGILRWIGRIIQLKKLKKNLNVIASISFLEGANYVNVLSSIGERTIISLRGSLFHDKKIKGPLGFVRKRILIPSLFNKATSIVAVSNAINLEMIDKFGIKKEKLTTVHNFYDLEQIHHLSREEVPIMHLPIFKKDVIINVGRLDKQKEHEGLLIVFKKVVSEHDCSLLLVGDGQEKDKLLRLCRETLNLRAQEVTTNSEIDPSAQVYFLGYISNPYRYIKKSKLFLLSSSWEGFPNSLIEAMICGTPVISTDCPTGPSEIMDSFTSDEFDRKDILITPYGSLMPILANGNKLIYSQWKSEILKYMKTNDLRQAVREASLRRVRVYDAESALTKWEAIIGRS